MRLSRCEYIWLDVKNNFRSKTKIMELPDGFTIGDLLIWNYDGSSTGQAIGTDSEIFLVPRAIYKDPFYSDEIPSYLIWCDWADKTTIPLENCTRPRALEILSNYAYLEPWFGIEQEYFILDGKTGLPIGFSYNSQPEPQGKYYCGVGSYMSPGREIANVHATYCIKAGIKLCGINAEVAPSQWEYQVGPCEGIRAGDDIWMSRYILNRVGEQFGCDISYHPKPLGHLDFNGSGAHTNFSTRPMREPNGIIYINKAIELLGSAHGLHMQSYGLDNEQRMSGQHETSGFHTFTVGRANRGASIRIPSATINEGRGYFEDRRPGANADPYLVTGLIMGTTGPAHGPDTMG